MQNLQLTDDFMRELPFADMAGRGLFADTTTDGLRLLVTRTRKELFYVSINLPGTLEHRPIG